MKYNPKWLTKHHRTPQSKGIDNRPENISYVPRNRHEWFHALFANKSVEEIVEDLNQYWLPRDYHLVVERRHDV